MLVSYNINNDSCRFLKIDLISDDDDDYDSEEDLPTINQDFNYYDSTTSSSTTQSSSTENIATSAMESVSQQTSRVPEKLSEIPITSANDVSSSAFPTPDPYFTHFDPRMEHQSYKVYLLTF